MSKRFPLDLLRTRHPSAQSNHKAASQRQSQETPYRTERTKSLASLEKIPYEIFEQIIVHLPPLWQTALLCSSAHLWSLFNRELLTTTQHRAALHEFLGLYEPGLASCDQCQKARTWKTDGHGSQCAHSMGRVFPNGYSVYSRKRQHLCVQQSILIGQQPGVYISFLQYRVLLKNLLLRPNPTFEPGSGAGILRENLEHIRDLQFRACNGGLCVKAEAHNLLYPDTFGLDPNGHSSDNYEYSRWAIQHVCAGKTRKEKDLNFLYRDLNRQVNELFLAVYGTMNQTQWRLYRCDWCVTEILLAVSSPRIIGPRMETSAVRKRALVRGDDPAGYTVSVTEYSWLGAALRPEQLPVNLFGPHAGTSASEISSFICIKDRFHDVQSPRSHIGLEAVTEPPMWRTWKEQGKVAPQPLRCRNSHWDRCNNFTSSTRVSCRCWDDHLEDRDGCGIRCSRQCMEPFLDTLKVEQKVHRLEDGTRLDGSR